MRVADKQDPSPLTRAGLRLLWRAAGEPWDAVPARHRPRNTIIARAYLDSDDTLAAIAARHGISRARVPVVARNVVYSALGLRPPGR